MITEQQQSEAIPMPSAGRDLVARLAELPELPRIDVIAPVDPLPDLLIEPDAQGLDEIVASCLEQLRQVMDELQ